MKAEDFTDMIIGAYQVGFMEAVRAYEPEQDLVRASAVKAWLKMMHIDAKKFDAMVNKGMVHPKRKGTGKNSPIYYSKADIKKAILTAKAVQMNEMEKMRESILNNPA